MTSPMIVHFEKRVIVVSPAQVLRGKSAFEIGDGGLTEVNFTPQRRDDLAESKGHADSDHAPPDAQKNIKPDYAAPAGSDSEILNKPTLVAQLNVSDLDNSTQVDNKIAAAVAFLIQSAPGLLDSFAEISAAINNDPDFAANIITALAGKLSISALDIITLNTAFRIAAHAPVDAQKNIKADYTALPGSPDEVLNKPVVVADLGLSDLDNSTQVDTKIAGAIAQLLGSAPGLLDSLDEISAAINDDPDFAANIATALAGKLSIDAQEIIDLNTAFRVSAHAPVDAQKNVKPDYAAPEGSAAGILNKPGVVADLNLSNLDNDVQNSVNLNSQFRVAAHAPADAQKNIKPDYTAAAGSDSEILNKPTLVAQLNVSDLDNSTQVDNKIAAAVALLIQSAPGLLDSFAEISAAINNDPDFAANIITALAGKLSVSAQDIIDLNTAFRNSQHAPVDAEKNALDSLSVGLADQSYHGQVVTLTLSEAVSFGDICYISASNTAKKASSASLATSPALYVAVASGLSGASCLFMRGGFIRNDAWSLSPNSSVYLGYALGSIQVLPYTPQDQEIIQILGISLSSGLVDFRPSLVTSKWKSA